MKTLSLSGLEQFRELVSARASQYDLQAEFPKENFQDLARYRLHTLTLPASVDGNGCGFEQTFQVIAEIASGCASTALCLAMHYYTVAGLGTLRSNEMLMRVFEDIRDNGAYMSSFNQPNVMSQYNKGQPSETVKISIKKVDGGYAVNGMKPFVSGCEFFKYYPVYGYQEHTGSKFGLTALMILRDDPGVSIEQAWLSSSMKATKSNHVQLRDVFVPEERLIGREGYAIEDTNILSYWSRLAISSVYYGIALAAYRYALDIVKKKTDIYSRSLLAVMPGPQFALADIRIRLETSFSQLLTFARQADSECEEGRFTDDLFQQSLVTKYYVTNQANEIVGKAMRIEGMNALNEGGLLERLYRDVRAATFHQPGDDLLMELLAKKSIGVMTLKNRWG